MPSFLEDALAGAGYVLDTPGALLRGVLSGRPGERASGQEMFGSWGLDVGPVGGFLADMVIDPLAIAGPVMGAVKGAGAISDGMTLSRRLAGLTPPSALDRRLGELGAMADPFDVLRQQVRTPPSSPLLDALRGLGGF